MHDKRQSTRIAIWRANSKKCFYCEEPISYRDLQIDHLIAESTPPDQVANLVKQLPLPSTFQLEDLINLVPTHHNCNRRKSDNRFSETTLRFYFDLWQRRQNAITAELDELRSEAEYDDLIGKIIGLVECGKLSLSEIIRVVAASTHGIAQQPSKPLVVTFGLNLLDSSVKALRSDKETYTEFWDRLENELMTTLRNTIGRPITITEPSQRTGETLSVRVAFWQTDIDRLQFPTPWELIEVNSFEEVYSDSPAELFQQAMEDTYDIFTAERDGCPKCGGKVIMSGSAGDTGEFAIATCMKCGWEDYYP